MHRLFVAIRPPELIRDLLIDAMDDSADFRWQDDEQLHLTLRFVGEVERPLAEDLAAALGSIRAPPFELRIHGAGRFEQRTPAHCGPASSPGRRSPRSPPRSSAPASRSASSPSGALSSAHHARPLEGAPQPRGRPFLERTRGLASDPFVVDRFILFESRLSRHGAQYEEVTSYPLETIST